MGLDEDTVLEIGWQGEVGMGKGSMERLKNCSALETHLDWFEPVCSSSTPATRA